MTLKEHMQKAQALFCDRSHVSRRPLNRNYMDAQTCIAVVAPDCVAYLLAVQHWKDCGQRFDDAIAAAEAKQSDDAAFDDIDPDKPVPM